MNLSLTSIADRIECLLGMSALDLNMLAAMLGTQASRKWQAQLVKCILCNDDFANQLAARSYLHGNGFYKLVLVDRGFKLRMHIWLPGTSSEENIHDHRWHIASTILAGQLESELWRDSCKNEEPGCLATEYRYLAQTTSQKSTVVPVKTVSLQLLQHCRYQAGESYSLGAERLHRIRHHGDQLVATLMCTTPSQAGHTRLIAGSEGLQPSTSRTPLSVNELREVVYEYLRLTNPSALRKILLCKESF